MAFLARSRIINCFIFKFWQAMETCSYQIIEQRKCLCVRVRIIVSNATFNNISIISWWSILLVEETRVPGDNYRPVTSHWQTKIFLWYWSYWMWF